MNALVKAPLRGEILKHADIRVIGYLRPMQQSRIEDWYPSGLTITDILLKFNSTHHRSAIADDFIISVDGVPVNKEWWSKVRPKPETTVVIQPVAKAFIAPAFAAIGAAVGTAASFLTGGSFFAQLALLGIGIGIKLLVNALFPPPKPEKQRQPREAYNFAGARNQSNPFGTLPVVLGKHRVSPYYGGLPYTEDKGDDQYLRALFVVGYGPLSISDIRIGETPITEYDDVTYEVKEGYVSDTKQKLYPNQVIEESLQITLEGPPFDDTANFQKHTRYTASNIDEIAVNFFLPNGLIRYDSEGKKQKLSVTIKIRYRAYPGGGAWTNRPDLVLNKRTINPLRAGDRWDVTDGPQYEVEIWREEPEEDPDSSSNARRIRTVQWGSIKGFRSGQPITFDKPLALISMRVKATSQLSGTLDEVNCIAYSKAKHWNGSTWVNDTATQWPMDLFRLVLQGPANRRPVADAKIDLTQLQAWGNYCMAQGFKYNRPISEQKSVFDMVQEIAAAGRATVVFKDGKWSVSYDEQSTPIVQMFTTRNTREFSSSREFPDLPHAWRIKFTNELKRYVSDERIVYDDGYTSANATKFETLELNGITHPNLVWKHGRFHIAQLRLRPEIYQLVTDFENLVCTRGDRVRINHDVMAVGSGSGRVVQVLDGGTDAQVVVMDEKFLIGSSTYQMRFRLADGTYLLRSVKADVPIGDTNTITFTGNDDLPEVGDIGTFGETASESAIYRILNIEQLEDAAARLWLVDDAPAIYSADTGTIPPFDSNVTEPLDPYTLPPSSISIQQSSYQIGNVIFGSVTLSWVAPPYGNVSGYNTQYEDDGVWRNGPTVPAGQLYATIDGLDADTYNFRVRATFASNGPADNVSNWLESGPYDMNFLSDPPPSVSNFRINSLGDASTLTWDPITVQSVTYEIRFLAAGASSVEWNNAVPILNSVIGTSAVVGTMVGWYMIKAVNQSKVKSLNATVIQTNVGEISGLNAIVTSTQDPTFSGTKDGTTAIASTLRLSNISSSPDVFGVEPEGIYYFATHVDLGETFTYRLTPAIEAQGNDVTNVMSSWPTLASVAFLDTSSQSDWSVSLEMRTAEDANSPASSPPAWSDWMPFTFGDVTSRMVDFRAILTGTKADEEDDFATVTPVITVLRVNIDMPDRVDGGKDILTSASGSYIAFTPPFRGLTGLSIAAQDMAVTTNVLITNKTRFGFRIQFIENSLSPPAGVAKTFDWVAKGYGREL